MKKFLFIALFVFSVFNVTRAQSTVTEISWKVYNIQYSGLMVLYPNNNGVFVVKYFRPTIGWIWVRQDAILTNTFDAYGNCTSYINCYNPQSSPNVSYAADNFVIYPNGQMYTQDAAGKWSTLIWGQIIPPVYWEQKMSVYGLK